MITRASLWKEVLIQRYIHPLTLLEWIRLPIKNFINASTVWKALVQAFPLMSHWLPWKVGNGKSIKFGVDPQIDCGNDFRLSIGQCTTLRKSSITSLGDASSLEGPFSLGWRVVEV
jgi:hypothetical protein